MTATMLNRQLDADMTLLDQILIEDGTSGSKTGSANARNPFQQAVEEAEDNKSSDFGRDSRASLESIPFTPEIRID